MQELRIGNKVINDSNPAYIIAEVGLAHQGDVKIAKKLIDVAVSAGCDCVKFQKRSLKDVYKKDVLEAPEAQEHALEYLLEHITKSELSEDEMLELRDYCVEKKIDFACTPWDSESLRFLSTLDMPFFKVGSPDMFNLPLLKEISDLKKPMLVSTGMSFVSEIEEVAKYLDSIGADYMFLHCNSTYPAPYHDINLSFLPRLKQISGGRPVGYSGHDSGITVSLGAVALGARVIEKHITLDRSLPGPDHKASLEPDEMHELVKQIRILEASVGEPVRFISRGEYMNRQFLSKSLVAARNIKKGEILNYADITVTGPGKGTSPLKLARFIGSPVLKRDIPQGDYILESDIGPFQGGRVKQKTDDQGDSVLEADAELSRPVSDLSEMKFGRKWGVVGRMTDIHEVLPCNSDFVEIHLSDSDVHENRLSDQTFDRDLVVHCPEYNKDLLIDLSSMDETKRKLSIEFFNKCLDHARELKKLFRNKNEKIKIVIHPGGMNMEYPLMEHKDKLYANLLDSLKQLNDEGLELLVENMPGSPWYFGGQWHHASFMDADEIVKFSKETGYGIVFDTSHAALYCNQYKKDFSKYVETIMPVVKYLHISDGARYNGEGLQIGDGTIDFKMLLEHVVKTNLWVLPEIWQGHKFGGEGFRIAMRSLKRINPAL
jgi:N-acetylneuraminate synthase